MESVIPAEAGIQQRRRHVRRSVWRRRLDPRVRGGDSTQNHKAAETT